MKKLLGIILVAITLNSFSQSFEGTLTYVVDLELSEKFQEKGIDKETFLNQMKKKGTWSDTLKITYKGGNYYTSLNNGEACLIYLSSLNKMYSMMLVGERSDICGLIDASADAQYLMSGKKPKIEKLDSQVVINGINCNIVRVEWETGIYDYYYNSSIFAVNPSLFEKHIYDAWSQFLEISKALPIQIVKTIGDFEETLTMTTTQTLIFSEEKSVDDNLFVVPKLVKDKKIYVNLWGTEIMRVKKNKRK